MAEMVNDSRNEFKHNSHILSRVGLYNYLPLAMCILMLVLALMYKVDQIRPQMEADLKARHEH